LLHDVFCLPLHHPPYIIRSSWQITARNTDVTLITNLFMIFFHLSLIPLTTFFLVRSKSCAL
jgi:hypothetical protein